MPGALIRQITFCKTYNSHKLLLLLSVSAGLVNVSLGYSGPAGAFCAGDTIADVLAQGPSCKAEVSPNPMTHKGKPLGSSNRPSKTQCNKFMASITGQRSGLHLYCHARRRAAHTTIVSFATAA